MKPTANPTEMIQFIPQPAFLVKNGLVSKVNNAAAERQISVGISISELITLGIDEYEALVSGKLYLQLKTGRAWVTVCDDSHLFCMEEDFSSPELRAFALAAQHLRLPLSNALSGAELLTQNETIQHNAELKSQLGKVNRNLYQIIRTVSNMSDVAQLGSHYNSRFEICDVSTLFDEIVEKITDLNADSGRKLVYRGLKASLRCTIDGQLLERAFLNMILNAFKYSPKDSTVLASLKKRDKRFILTVENSIQNGFNAINNNAFARFLREPGIESSQLGIGLGLSIISRAASAHGGVVLLDTVKQNTARVTISIPIQTECNPGLRSPLILLDGYTGGIDNYLIELSEILSSSHYESI